MNDYLRQGVAAGSAHGRPPVITAGEVLQAAAVFTTKGCVRPAHVLLLALLLLTCAAWLRAPEYDEAYSIFQTAGHPRPVWPSGVFHPADVRGFYRGTPTLEEIAQGLRKTDVHPPLYFWLLEYWRRLFGPGWFAARMLSVLITTGALAALAWLAALSEIPVIRTMMFALLSYGFAYTGIVIRGFALAQLLNTIGMALVLSALRKPGRPRSLGLAAGLAFGAAGFSNYLAVFVGLAAFFWLAVQRRRSILVAAILGFAAFLPALLFFFLAQRNARIGQFQAFSPPHAIALLAKDFGAALFGGLPLYAGHAGSIVTLALMLLTLICASCIVKNWKPGLSLFAFAVLFVPAGLFALGLVFNNTPIEIRYLAFAIPFVALLLARTLPPALAGLLLAVQACGIAGLILAPSTMQPQALAARQAAGLNMPDALVLLPFGNDGVGIPGPFIAAAPPGMRLQLLRPGVQPDLSFERDIILIRIGIDDASKKSTGSLLAALDANPCWRLQASPPLLNRFTRTCETH